MAHIFDLGRSRCDHWGRGRDVYLPNDDVYLPIIDDGGDLFWKQSAILSIDQFKVEKRVSI